MRRLIWITGLLATALPVAAQAQTCAVLRAQMAGNAAQLARIAYDYPKTHAAIVICYTGNESEDEAAICANAMVFGACLGMGPDYCDDLTARWERASATYFRIATRMREYGCRP